MLLIEVSPYRILSDEIKYPNREKDRFIFEHLKYLCSKLTSLPTLTIQVDSQGAWIKRGHYYLTIAKMLQMPNVKAIVDSSSSNENIECFLETSTANVLDWETERLTERDVLHGYVQYLLFFQRILSEEEKQEFEEKIVNFFGSLRFPVGMNIPDVRINNLAYPYSGICAEFEAYVPILDESWYGQSRSVLIDFHLQNVPIVSFQGMKWEFPL
ncbi:hypothetical protein [Chamaesiphon polymorphus]|uniref:Uncharacterized protein n=1 Tax=Chamaesiphon polymorphus CCALA 037 TaxID=2107692 RepID=A0A2T1GD64_9CYAN|nr:hypothetical protein [Chamaesiphon polymorphus]PSB55342.1 hypothetical protein C7B77_15345 [Chamaesiphon polymorphus CCALA 037]